MKYIYGIAACVSALAGSAASIYLLQPGPFFAGFVPAVLFSVMGGYHDA